MRNFHRTVTPPQGKRPTFTVNSRCGQGVQIFWEHLNRESGVRKPRPRGARNARFDEKFTGVLTHLGSGFQAKAGATLSPGAERRRFAALRGSKGR